MIDATNQANRWWEQQSIKRRVFSRLLLTAVLRGCDNARWQQCEGRFRAVPNGDVQERIQHRLGHRTFNMVLRELVNQGLTLDRSVGLSIPVGDHLLDVEVSLFEQGGGNEPGMNFSWERTDEPKRLDALSELVGHFPPNRCYRAIRGCVVDHSGRPVVKAQVATQSSIERDMRTSPDGRLPIEYVTGQCLTDDQGKFELQLIENDDDWREEPTVLVALSEKLKVSSQRVEDSTGLEDIENVDFQLSAPGELLVKFDLEQDDVVAPIRLHLECVGIAYGETHLVQSSGEMKFSNLAPGTYLVSVHQMGDDLARQVVELKSNESVSVVFGKPQKLELQGEVICTSRPEEMPILEIGFKDKHESPFSSYRESEDGNYASKTIKVWPDFFEPVEDGRWKFAFPVRNLVGGIYEFKISLSESDFRESNGWKKYSFCQRSKVILINGDTPVFEPLDLEWTVDDTQTFQLRIGVQ